MCGQRDRTQLRVLPRPADRTSPPTWATAPRTAWASATAIDLPTSSGLRPKSGPSASVAKADRETATASSSQRGGSTAPPARSHAVSVNRWPSSDRAQTRAVALSPAWPSKADPEERPKYTQDVDQTCRHRGGKDQEQHDDDR